MSHGVLVRRNVEIRVRTDGKDGKGRYHGKNREWFLKKMTPTTIHTHHKSDTKLTLVTKWTNGVSSVKEIKLTKQSVKSDRRRRQYLNARMGGDTA